MTSIRSPSSVRVLLLAVTFVAPAPVRADVTLASPRQLLAAKRVDFVGKNTFALERTDAGEMLRSVPHRSASGFYKSVLVEGRSLASVRWTWRIDTLHKTADLRRLEREDSCASIFFLFGEPSMMNQDVPTLAYAWSSTPVPPGTMIRSQRFASLRYVHMHGAESVGSLRSEIRDVAGDYRAAFHREPDTLRYIAVFNDNDQTGEPCSALFGSIVAH